MRARAIARGKVIVDEHWMTFSFELAAKARPTPTRESVR